ncbi:MAG: hypothetical protein ACJ763_06490 [Bdellovibrionia bacterium]
MSSKTRTYLIAALTLTIAILSLTDAPVNAIYCCEQSDPSSCAIGISVTRYYCYPTLTACLNGTCDAGY